MVCETQTISHLGSTTYYGFFKSITGVSPSLGRYIICGMLPLSASFSRVRMKRYWLYVDESFPFSISIALAMPLARSTSASAFSFSASSLAFASSTNIFRFCSALAISALPAISCCQTLYVGNPHINPTTIRTTKTIPVIVHAIMLLFSIFICVQLNQERFPCPRL